MTRLPDWADWNMAGAAEPWTVGIEEEVMLIDPRGWALASRADEALAALPAEVAEQAAPETHGSVLELAGRPHRTVAAAVAELARLRGALAATLEPLELRAAVSGTHPFAQWNEIEVSPGARYQAIYDSMRELARREPTFALHVHVAVPEPEAALRALRGLRAHVPVLLALAANSPFWQGRDSGLAATRVPIFGGFPRVGIPRAFADYADYVEAVDVLLRCGALPEPTYLWWDVRLQPRFGTIEVRIMDAQTRVADSAALVALVQCLVRRAATGEDPAAADPPPPEVLDENRFLAARDGMRAALIDAPEGCTRPVDEILAGLVEACRPHAAELDCVAELDSVATLAAEPGYQRQRIIAGVGQGDSVGNALGLLVTALASDFTAAPADPPPAAPRSRAGSASSP